MGFFAELKRRNVFRVGAAYLLAAWVLLQAVDFVLDAIGAPTWVLQVFILAAAVGLPAVLAFSWVFEMTPEGMKRESEIDRSQSITAHTGRKLDRVIIVFLVLAVAILLADRFVGKGSENLFRSTEVQTKTAALEKGPPAPVSPAAKSVAVLPFLALSSGQDDEYFADGLTEEILNALAQLPELLVTARTSSFHFKGQDVPIQEIAARLGVSNLVEGSVRRAGKRLRVTAQLIRAADGFHLWSEDYDSTSADTIAVQEDIAEKIASAMNVVMDADKRTAMRRAGLRNVEAFIAMQKGLELFEKAHGDPDLIGLLRQSNVYFERVEQLVPTYSLAYQQHSDLYIHQLMNGAAGEKEGLTATADVNEAMARARADYEAAVRNAHTPEERSDTELDLAFVSSDWRGMPARIERFTAEKGCSEPSWYPQLSLPFGYASRVVHRAREFVVCDPLSSSAWRGAVRAQLWAGDPEAALQSAKQGSQQAPGEWLSTQLIASMVALGQFEQAETEVTERLRVDSDILASRLMIAAARGDKAKVARLLQQVRQDPQALAFWGPAPYAWSGDHEGANEVAAHIDGHAFRSPVLSSLLLWCVCGAPWDLSATPNFAADLKEAGLPWPPVSPIKFPLKDW